MRREQGHSDGGRTSRQAWERTDVSRTISVRASGLQINVRRERRERLRPGAPWKGAAEHSARRRKLPGDRNPKPEETTRTPGLAAGLAWRGAQPSALSPPAVFGWIDRWPCRTGRG